MATDITFTPNLHMSLLPSNYRVWTQKMNDNLTLIDAAITAFVRFNNLRGVWSNSTAYAVGDTVSDNDSAVLYTAQVANVSSTIPTTFLEERLAYPSYWTPAASAATNRGAWTGPGTGYNVNDFVLADGTKYAMCLVQHVSGNTFSADLALGNWAVIIDLSTVGSQVLPVLTPGVDNDKFVGADGSGIGYIVFNGNEAMVRLRGVLDVPRGGTGTGTSTGNGSVVLSDSPALTGNPTAPTAAVGDNDTSIATTAFVKLQNYITAAALGAYLPLTGGTMSGWIVAPSFVGIPDLNDYALSLGRYSAAFGRAAINTQGNYGYEFQVNGNTALQVDVALVTFPGNIASLGGIGNGFEWAGWLYNTTNMSGFLPVHHQGLATAWNYEGTGWQNYVNGWPFAGHHFQTWTDTTYTALTDAPVMFQTPAAATEDHTGATTAFVKQHGATSSYVNTVKGAAVPITVINTYVNGPNTGVIGAAGQVWALFGTAIVDFAAAVGSTDFFQARFWNGSAGINPTTFTAMAGVNTSMTFMSFVTLTASTTFTLQVQNLSNGRGNINADTQLIAMRIA